MGDAGAPDVLGWITDSYEPHYCWWADVLSGTLMGQFSGNE